MRGLWATFVWTDRALGPSFVGTAADRGRWPAMSSWFSRLKDAATSVSSAAAAAVSEVSAAAERLIPSLDAMQESFGDPTGRKALFEGLDLSYLTPRVIGA